MLIYSIFISQGSVAMHTFVVGTGMTV